MIQCNDQYKFAQERLTELHDLDDRSEDEENEVLQIEADIKFFEDQIDSEEE